MRRLSALLVVFAILVGVCPVITAAMADDHACCGAKVGEEGPSRVLSCCADEDTPGPPVPFSTAPAASKQVSGDAVPGLGVAHASHLRSPVRWVIATHGLPPIPPLLGSCQQRV